jgi:hypothetical protein
MPLIELHHRVRQAFVFRVVRNELRVSTALQDLFLRGKVGIRVEDEPFQYLADLQPSFALLQTLMEKVDEVNKLFVLYVGKRDANAILLTPGKKVLLLISHD